MHELSLVEGLVAAVEEQVTTGRIATIRLEIGRLTGVDPEAFRFCFDICKAGTRLEAATLEIVEVAPFGHCRSCGEGRSFEPPFPLCPCGSADLELLRGGELRVRDVEVI